MKNILKTILVIVVISMITMLFSGCIGEPSSILTNKSTPTIDKVASKVTPIVTQKTNKQIDKPVDIPKIQLENYNGGVFSLKKPVGWEVITAGSCTTLGILVRDRNAPQNQIFIFHKVGPVFLSEQAKSETTRYMQMGGYPIPWYEMPVVNPFTPENLLSNEYLITSTSTSKQYMSQAPSLQNIEIIASTNIGTPIGGSAKIMRALFQQNNKLSEGMFYVITPTHIQNMPDPMLEIEYGYLFTGISADKDKFRFIQNELFQSLESIIISDSYLQECTRSIDEETKIALKNAKIYSDISDIYMKSWEDRNKADDIMSEKKSDERMGRDRIYDADTGLVYEVSPEYYEKYDKNREKFNKNNLQRIPTNSYELWTSVPLNANNIN